jgi:CheY-like chemotaxis protein
VKVGTVLVVDDSELTHALLRRALENGGYDTVHAANADEALRLIEQEPVDAMVVDIVMPNIDGIQLVQLVRSRRDVDRSMPVVFYSAHIDHAERQRIAGMQPATIVAKDGNVQDLVEAVTNVISAHASAALAATPAAVILHVGKGLVALRLQRDGKTVFELRRGSEVLLEAPTVEELMQHARSAGLA